MRTIPAIARAEYEQETTAEIPLVFLHISHSELSDPIRIVSDPENYMLDLQDGNGSKLYIGFEFEINLLSDGENMPSARIAVQNVDTIIGQAVRNSAQPAILEIIVISSNEFNEANFPRTQINTPANYIYRAQWLRLTDVEGDVFQLTGTIRSWDYTQENWPGLRVTESRFPGIYW